ncbi:hypothetical protein [Microbacterium paludicola]|uniref:hypothetical protein n=1 Tax=Microbacterium paludicola TaxID=300019 RepID=UPI0031DA5D21
MSTPDEPSQPLTRRQLRELKLTGQTPVITPEIQAANDARGAAEAHAEAAPEVVETETPEAPAPAQDVAEPVAPEAARAEEAAPDEEPGPAEEAAALEAAAEESSAPGWPVAGGRPLTRREVREQERLRTNQMAVIPPADEDAPLAFEPHVAAIETKIVGENETSVVYEVVEVPFEQPAAEQDDDPQPSEQTEPAGAEVPVAELVYEDAAPEKEAEQARPEDEFADAAVQTVFVAEDAPADGVEEERPTVAPAFGSTVLRAPAPATPTAASFEEILTQSSDSSGTSTAGSTLILATDPGAIPLSAPIDATGEILVTSTHALPDGFGSRGHAAGTTDGKEVDVVLIDGELPLASSPTPISASDAVSTSKSPAEVIRPPAPEKSHRLTLILGIAAGVLGIALIGVVVAAFTTGVLG